MLEAIFWEPEVFYLIHSIRVVKKGAWTSFLRNEVTKVISLNNVLTWMKDPARFDPICAGGGARDGTQRNMLALEGVEYIVTAEMNLTGLGQRSNQKLRKYWANSKGEPHTGSVCTGPVWVCVNFRQTSSGKQTRSRVWNEEPLKLAKTETGEVSGHTKKWVSCCMISSTTKGGGMGSGGFRSISWWMNRPAVKLQMKLSRNGAGRRRRLSGPSASMAYE